MQWLAIFTNISTSRTLLIPVQLPMVKVLGLGFSCHSKGTSFKWYICISITCSMQGLITVFMHVQVTIMTALFSATTRHLSSAVL